MFLSLALGLAEVVGADDIFYGANALDYSGYPDCRPAFARAFEALANVATRAVDEPGRSIRIHAPLMDRRKADIIRRGARAGRGLRLDPLLLRPGRRPRVRQV